MLTFHPIPICDSLPFVRIRHGARNVAGIICNNSIVAEVPRLRAPQAFPADVVEHIQRAGLRSSGRRVGRRKLFLETYRYLVWQFQYTTNNVWRRREWPRPVIIQPGG